jgi:hypothetical protein
MPFGDVRNRRGVDASRALLALDKQVSRRFLA